MQKKIEKISKVERGTLMAGGVIGACHQEKKMPCQDASAAGIYYYKGYSYMLMAVADGHGSSHYPRSELGAHFAVQAATDAAAVWIMFATDCLERQPANWLSNVQNEFGSRFARYLHHSWGRKVDEHLTNFPLEDVAGDINFCRSAYGTTISLALIFNNHIFTGAIGDSSVLIVRNSEDTLDVLAGDESPQLGLVTHSLAQDNAVLKWKHRVFPVDEVSMICVATDGFTDSLVDVQGTLAALHQDTRLRGFDWLHSKLPDFLSHLTDKGVGDDISVVFYFSPVNDIPAIKDTGEENE